MGTVHNIDEARKAKRLIKLQGRLYDGEIDFCQFMEEYTKHFGDDDMGELYNPFEHDGAKLSDE